MNEVTLNDSNFEAEVLKSEKPVLVDFWAPWCGPCKMMAPVIEEVASEVGEKIKIAEYNVDESPKFAEQYQVMSIPTFMIFAKGQIVDQWSGVTAKEDMLARINKVAA